MQAKTKYELYKRYIICPREFNKASGKIENKLIKIDNNRIIFKNHEYKIKNGVVDMTIADNRNTYSYDKILSFLRVNELKSEKSKSKFFNANGLRKKNLTGKVVLMAGIGRGEELNWILDFRPKLIIAVDISNYNN